MFALKRQTSPGRGVPSGQSRPSSCHDQPEEYFIYHICRVLYVYCISIYLSIYPSIYLSNHLIIFLSTRKVNIFQNLNSLNFLEYVLSTVLTNVKLNADGVVCGGELGETLHMVVNCHDGSTLDIEFKFSIAKK